MPIPESQLETWSHQGATTTAMATHKSIRTALEADSSPVRYKGIDIFLQGSYKNTTNIRGDSDVDVVVQLNDTFHRDLTNLSDYERSLYESAHSAADYHWKDLRADVITALEKYYGSWMIDPGNKAIEVAGESGRLSAHVVPCLQYRLYHHFWSEDDQEYTEGIVLYTDQENRQIINFPKPHYDNGAAKNATMRTNGWYKPTVRMFKNARTYLVGQGVISEDLAPSYFLECLLYNVPDSAFQTDFQTAFYQVINWLNNADLSRCICQNEQLDLFGDSPEQWSTVDAQECIAALIDLWNNW